MKKRNYVLYWALPLLGIIFSLIYLKRSAYNMVFADYIRLTNSYLPNPWDPSKFFVPDILTRIPLNFLARGINVTFFGFNTIFDMVLGVFGLGASAFLLGKYAKENKIGTVAFGIMMFVVFSLNKWEMLTNGTGWIHFTAFIFFYYHYMVLDRLLVQKKGKSLDSVKLMVLPFIITLGVAGPYCAIYSLTVILAYLWIWFTNKDKNEFSKKECLIYCLCVVIPFILYIISNHFVVEPKVGGNQPLLPTFFKNPLYFLKFFLASFGSIVLGNETVFKLCENFHNYILIYSLGAIVILFYGYAFYLNFKEKLYQKTIFPLIFLVSGGLNHLLILYSRWRFMGVQYGMESRYALQYQIGILGIIMTFALVSDKWKKAVTFKTAVVFFGIFIIMGNLITTSEEWKKSPYRKEYLKVKLGEVALNFEEASDEELAWFQYPYPELTVNALKILKENKLNIFRED